MLRNNGSGTLSWDTTTYLSANQTITLSGDVSGTGTTAITTAIGANKVTLGMMAQVATATFLGRVTAATGNVEALTATQATSLLDTFSTSATTKGLVNGSNSIGNAYFLRADNSWAIPTGNISIAATQVAYGSGTNAVTGSSTFTFDPTTGVSIALGVITNVTTLLVSASYNNYLQENLKNNSNGIAASGDYVVTADTGTETANYIDLGINSSGYTGDIFGAALDGYLYVNGGNLNIGTDTSAKVVNFLVGGASVASNTILALASTGATVTGNISTTSTRFAWNDTNNTLALTQAAASGTVRTILTVTGGAITTSTLSTERVDVDFALNRTIQFATGGITNQRSVIIRGPTLTAVGGSTFTTTSALHVIAPTISTNVTSTNRYAMTIEGGRLGLAACATTYASIRVPHGTTPTTVADGDTWSTTVGFFRRVNGATIPDRITVNALATSGTIAVNCQTGTQQTVGLTASSTIANPTNAVNGMTLLFIITQGGTGSYTVTWDTQYQFSADLPAPVLGTAVGAIDIVLFRYNSAVTKWQCLSYMGGYV